MTVLQRGLPLTKVLVRWKHRLLEEASWEYYSNLKKWFPSFNPWIQGFSYGGIVINVSCFRGFWVVS